jgi:hypothetical protein
MQEAVQAWVSVYLTAKQINEYAVLQALSKLAPQLGMEEGLEGWEKLAQQIANGEEVQVQNKPSKSEEQQIAEFVQAVVVAVREKSDDASKLFEAVSKMAVDPKAPPHYQKLGSVLKKYMSGVKKPDLSGLPDEIADIVMKAIQEG